MRRLQDLHILFNFRTDGMLHSMMTPATIESRAIQLKNLLGLCAAGFQLQIRAVHVDIRSPEDTGGAYSRDAAALPSSIQGRDNLLAQG